MCFAEGFSFLYKEMIGMRYALCFTTILVLMVPIANVEAKEKAALQKKCKTAMSVSIWSTRGERLGGMGEIS